MSFLSQIVSIGRGTESDPTVVLGLYIEARFAVDAVFD